DEPRGDAELREHPLDVAPAAVHEQGPALVPAHLVGQGSQEPGVLQRGTADLVDADAHAQTGSPAVSGRPAARFRFWMAWPAAPFTRLSSAANTTARPGAAACTDIRQRLVGATSDRRGGRSTTRTNGSPA